MVIQRKDILRHAAMDNLGNYAVGNHRTGMCIRSVTEAGLWPGCASGAADNRQRHSKLLILKQESKSARPLKVAGGRRCVTKRPKMVTPFERHAAWKTALRPLTRYLRPHHPGTGLHGWNYSDPWRQAR